MEVSAEKLAVLVRSDDAFALNANTARPTRDLTRHVLVGIRARHICPRILADLHKHKYTHTHTRLTAFVQDYPGKPVPER